MNPFEKKTISLEISPMVELQLKAQVHSGAYTTQENVIVAAIGALNQETQRPVNTFEDLLTGELNKLLMALDIGESWQCVEPLRNFESLTSGILHKPDITADGEPVLPTPLSQPLTKTQIRKVGKQLLSDIQTKKGLLKDVHPRW